MRKFSPHLWRMMFFERETEDAEDEAATVASNASKERDRKRCNYVHPKPPSDD
jgi:hypothetical protein